MFVSTRGYISPTESAVAVYRDRIRIGSNLRLNVGIDVADKTAVVHVLTKCTDGNNAICGTNGGPGGRAQGNIREASAVVTQRATTDGDVAEAGGVVN